MNPKLLLLTLTMVVGCLGQQKTSYLGYKLLDIYPLTQEQVNLIGELQHSPDFDLWSEKLGHPDGVKVSLSPEAFEKYTVLFQLYNIEYKIVENNLQARFDEEAEQMRLNRLKNGKNIVGTFARYADHMNFKLQMVDENPTMCSTYVAGKTVENRDLRVLVIKGNNPTRKIWIDCGIHAREWVTPATCIWIIDKLIKDYKAGVTNVVTILNRYEFHIMSLNNPDGYEFSHTSTRLHRKNRKPNPGSTCLGVDLNRNYPDHWFTGGSSNQPCSDTYAGPSANSEFETQAVVSSLNRYLGLWDVFFTIHSYGKWVFTPYGWSTTQTPPNYQAQLTKARIMGQRIMQVYGQTGWTWGSSAQLLYIASGGSDDTSYSLGVPYNHCVELRPGQTGVDANFGFTLPEDRCPAAGEETYQGILALLTDVINNG